MMSPLTTEKYGIDQIIKQVRNDLCELGCITPIQVLKGDVKYKPGEEFYYFGTARKLKGTEREVVILIAPSKRYGVPENEYRKALYVCLSRAIKKLIIILSSDECIQLSSPLGQIIKSDENILKNFKFKSDIVQAKTSFAYTRVRDDLSISKTIEVKFSEYSNNNHSECPKLEDGVMKIPSNEDFVGLYIEALFAIKLGADIKNWLKIIKSPKTNLRVLTRKETQVAQGKFIEKLEDGSFRLLLKYGELPKIPDEILECKDLAYVITVLNYSSQIGKIWCASQQVLKMANIHRQELDNLIRDLIKYLKLDDNSKHIFLSWGEPLIHHVNCTRSEQKKHSCIMGISDLLFDNLVVEIKFSQHKEEHLRQVAIYSSILGVPALLVNVQQGKIYCVEPAKLEQVEQYAHGGADGPGGGRGCGSFRPTG